MNLLYDLIASQPGKFAKFHGGGLYAEVIFFALLDDYSQIELTCVYDSHRYINPMIMEKCQEKNITVIDINTLSIPQIIENQNIDIFYTALPEIHHNTKIENCIFAGTIHGPRSLEMYIDSTAWHYAKSVRDKIIFLIRYIFKKQLLKYRVHKVWGKLFFNPCFKFITVSEHSRFSVASFFPNIDNEDINVFYSPLMDQLNDYNEEDIRDLSELIKVIPKKYYLMTSGERWLKNNLKASLALDELFTEHPAWDFKVVITGVRTKSIYTKHIKNKDKFIFLDFVERGILESLHREAYAFIYPSLNEGFGYPPLESMKYRVPVIASGISAIPEICGNAVIYFNPFCKDEIKNRILQLQDDNIYNFLSNTGYDRYLMISNRQKKDLYGFVNYLKNGMNL